jgi:hypothetical protein
MSEANEPYENTLTLEELRLEVRRCWNAQHELSIALKDLPEMPGHAAMRLIDDYPHGAWPRVWELGKAEQRRLVGGHGGKLDFSKHAVPYKTEYEIAAGVWSIIRDSLRAAFLEPSDDN